MIYCPLYSVNMSNTRFCNKESIEELFSTVDYCFDFCSAASKTQLSFFLGGGELMDL